jgi:hypothetical protein
MPTKKGHTKYIETPDKLWDLFVEFMEWVENNPYKVQDYVGKDGDMVYREKQRPLTWSGFEKYLYLNGVISDLRSYEQNENESYTDYLPIVTRIKAICHGEMIEGASSGVYNANIAARVVGLVDKREVEQKEPRIFKLD